MDPAAIRRVDRSDMLGLVAALPAQFNDGFARGWRLSLPPRAAVRRIEQVATVGMGGSAISGDLVKALLAPVVTIPIQVHRIYDLPGYIGPRTLVIASSYSGETEETLSAYAQARRRGARLVVVTSGGRLGRWAQRDGVPWGQVPAGLPPRAALGYLAGIPLGLLAAAGLSPVTAAALRAATRATAAALRAWAPEAPASRNRARQLAAQLRDRLVVVYGADGGWEAVVARWRGQLAENAKHLASSHLLPEMNHNEINGWRFPAMARRCAAVFLSDPSLHPRVRRRIAITAELLRRRGARTLQIEVPGPTPLARLLSMIALGDALSVYLAAFHRVDPTPVEDVAYLKRSLSRT
ncbi:MAG: bifunctional phosphoglucose/phosphomannose isomerase [Candidatus Omnitrophica bacterium]|nr:bifunctional phosphoglucose/phosphomannose isomerase [Candidatus Omnitrophota bacterium]